MVLPKPNIVPSCLYLAQIYLHTLVEDTLWKSPGTWGNQVGYDLT